MCARRSGGRPLRGQHRIGFQHQAEADRFPEDFRKRLGKFGLELHPEKTRRIEFGRFAEDRPEKKRGRKARTVRLSGFHAHQREGPEWDVCGEAQYQPQAHEVEAASDQAAAARQRMHDPTGADRKWLQSVVQGYFNYHAVPGNARARLPGLGRRAISLR